MSTYKSNFYYAKRFNWQAANYSQFWGKTLEYGFSHRLGTNLPEIKQKAMKQLNYFDDLFQIAEIPAQYDFRSDPEVKGYLRKNPIRDQGDCAASWAFSTIGTYQNIQKILIIKNFIMLTH